MVIYDINPAGTSNAYRRQDKDEPRQKYPLLLEKPSTGFDLRSPDMLFGTLDQKPLLYAKTGCWPEYIRNYDAFRYGCKAKDHAPRSPQEEMLFFYDTLCRTGGHPS